MAENSAISWTTHTFNPWVGCTKVSPGCAHCYAEADFDKRKGFAKWGAQGTRVVTSDANWKKPVRWNAAAEWWCPQCRDYCFEMAGQCRGCGGACRKSGPAERPRVFCASLADVFEWSDTMSAEAMPVVRAARVRLFRLIFETPHLDWLLLTKRPEHMTRCIADVMHIAWGVPQKESPFAQWMEDWLTNFATPKNVWLGTSVENQAAADARIPHLLATPAAVRFLSMEPLLGPVDLERIRIPLAGESFMTRSALHATDSLNKGKYTPGRDHRVDWVIVGGESGRDARPMHPDWARALRDQCTAAGVAYHFKQWGEYAPESAGGMFSVGDKTTHTIDELGRLDERRHGGELIQLRRVGKKDAGRLLDGRTWDEFPNRTEAA